LRGLTIKTGVNMRPIQVANIAKAASSSPPKTSSRSHRLTAAMCQQRYIRISDNEAGSMQALAPVMRGLMLSGKTDSVMDQAQGTVLRIETTWRPVHGILKSHGPCLASRWAQSHRQVLRQGHEAQASHCGASSIREASRCNLRSRGAQEDGCFKYASCSAGRRVEGQEEYGGAAGLQGDMHTYGRTSPPPPLYAWARAEERRDSSLIWAVGHNHRRQRG
jgi:hypothetical protein